MKGIDPFGLIAGIVMVVGGLALLIASLFVVFLVIYGVIVLIIGIVILATLRKQEEIEPIKLKSRRGKK